MTVGVVKRGSWRQAMVAASLLAVGRPDLWATALAGFLIRGGIVVLLLPVVILPTPIGLAASFGLDAVSISGEPTARFVQEVGLALTAMFGWVLIAGLVGAVVDVAVAKEVAGVERDVGAESAFEPGIGWAPEEGRHPRARRLSTSLLGQLLLTRLVTLVPLAFALAWAVRRIVEVGYQEVTVPSDTAVPLALRIAFGASDAVIAIVATWLVTEFLMALATRRLMFEGDDASRDAPFRRTWVSAAWTFVRRLPPMLAAFVIGAAASIGLLAAVIVASSATWDRLQALFRVGDPGGQMIAIVALILVWGAGLVLAGALSAWRSALMTAAYLWASEAQDRRSS